LFAAHHLKHPKQTPFVASTRSPKDVALRTEMKKTQRIFDKELRSLSKGLSEEEDADADLRLAMEVIAIIRASSRVLRVESGAEAVKYLCCSERAYQDLTMRLLTAEDSPENAASGDAGRLDDDEDDAASGKAEFESNDAVVPLGDMHVTVREWASDLLPEYEFRAFVFNKNLNAVSQYYKACYVPQLVARKEEYSRLIRDFFYSEMRDNIDLDHYVIDFAVTKTDRVVLVELNHFKSTTSSALFDWTRDSEIMHHGPYTFRVLEQLPINVKQQIARPLRALANWEESDDTGANEAAEQYAESSKRTGLVSAAKRLVNKVKHVGSKGTSRAGFGEVTWKYGWAGSDRADQVIGDGGTRVLDLAGPAGLYQCEVSNADGNILTFWTLSHAFLKTLGIDSDRLTPGEEDSARRLATSIAVCVLEIELHLRGDQLSEGLRAHATEQLQGAYAWLDEHVAPTEAVQDAVSNAALLLSRELGVLIVFDHVQMHG
jgi:D123